MRDEPGYNSVNVDLNYQFGGAQQQRSGAGASVAHAILDTLESHCETAVTIVSVAHHEVASADYVGSSYYVELRARNGVTRHGIGLGKNLNDAAAAAVCSGIRHYNAGWGTPGCCHLSWPQHSDAHADNNSTTIVRSRRAEMAVVLASISD